GDEIVEERALLNRAWIARVRQRQIDRENSIRRVARTDALERDERAHHEAGAKDEHERQRDLTDHERPPQPRMPHGHERPLSLLQDRGQIDVAHLKYRRKAEEGAVTR